MRVAFLIPFAALALSAQPKVDNVLVKMVPPNVTALTGAQIQAVIATPLYVRLISQQSTQAFDKFTAETGLDPRRDVREILFAATPYGSVLLARGHFDPKRKPVAQATVSRHGVYNIWVSNGNGLCILDSTLAAAGKLTAVEAALDEWTKGQHTAAAPLLARMKQADPNAQLWAVSTGVSKLLSSDTLPGAGSGLDLTTLFRGLTETWLQANLSTGLKFEAHGLADTVKDAQALRDAAKGAIGMGRLNVPEDKPDLLPVFDGIVVEQQDRAIAIRIDIPQNRIDPLVALLSNRAR